MNLQTYNQSTKEVSLTHSATAYHATLLYTTYGMTDCMLMRNIYRTVIRAGKATNLRLVHSNVHNISVHFLDYNSPDLSRTEEETVKMATQPSIQWTTCALSTNIKRPGREN